MSFTESLVTAVFVMLVVFVVLACLYFLIKLYTFGITKFELMGKKSE